MEVKEKSLLFVLMYVTIIIVKESEEMEENKKRGASFFYAVVGVATLVVAIVGATFAYFSTSATNNNTVQGEAATAGISLSVEKVSTGATGALIPLQDGTAPEPYNVDHRDEALQRTEENLCVDMSGNNVCQLYKITVKNDGNTTIGLTGTLKLTATGYTNLKWLNFNQNEGFDDGSMTDGSLWNNGRPANVANFIDAVTNDVSDTTIVNEDIYIPEKEKFYFILIYIAETGTAQENTDKGSFTGVVTFNGVNGKGVTSTFNG